MVNVDRIEIDALAVPHFDVMITPTVGGKPCSEQDVREVFDKLEDLVSEVRGLFKDIEFIGVGPYEKETVLTLTGPTKVIIAAYTYIKSRLNSEAKVLWNPKIEIEETRTSLDYLEELAKKREE